MTERGRWPHGTRYAYQDKACRCPTCRGWAVESFTLRRARRLGRPVPDYVAHGTPGAYTNWRCRCAACVDAYNKWRRAWRARGSGTPAPSCLDDRTVEQMWRAM